MNRYTDKGVIVDAVRGSRVIVVSSNRAELRAMFTRIAERVADRAIQVRRSNGAERITFASGGSIIFRSTAQSLRGFEADVLFVHGWNGLTERQLAEIVPVACSGELIRA